MVINPILVYHWIQRFGQILENILSLILQFWHILFSSCKSILDDNVLVISCLLAKVWTRNHPIETSGNKWMFQVPGINLLEVTSPDVCVCKYSMYL